MTCSMYTDSTALLNLCMYIFQGPIRLLRGVGKNHLVSKVGSLTIKNINKFS